MKAHDVRVHHCIIAALILGALSGSWHGFWTCVARQSTSTCRSRSPCLLTTVVLYVKRLSLVLCLTLASFGRIAWADNPPVRNGMPCVEEVCVGDDAMALQHVQWQTAVIPGTDTPLTGAGVSDHHLERLRLVLRGDRGARRAVAPYWITHQVDGVGLGALSRIRAVCEYPGLSHRLRGTYLSRQGFRTVVSFEPVASDDASTLRFVVASIHQYVDGSPTSPRLMAIGEQFAARYAGLPMYASAAEAAAAWLPAAMGGPHLRLLAPFGDSMKLEANLRKHPECAAQGSDATLAPPSR